MASGPQSNGQQGVKAINPMAQKEPNDRLSESGSESLPS